MIVTVAFVDLRGAIGFSSFGVLIYYFIANAAALRQSRRRPSLPARAAGAGRDRLHGAGGHAARRRGGVGVVVVLVGVAYRFARLRIMRHRAAMTAG